MLKLRRAELSADYMQAASAVIADRLLDLLAGPLGTDTSGASSSLPRTVMLYRALPGEVNLDTLADDLRARGVQVVLPKVAGELLEVRCYDGPGSLEKGAFGIMEPVGPLYAGQIDAVVVPGLGFDLAGGRIGFGKGFYDRFLASSHIPLKIGVCYRRMLLDQVPTDAPDLPIDTVITE